jgi:hypothetical protein
VNAAIRRASLVAFPLLALAAALAPWPPALVERAFTGGAYAALQPALTGFSNRLPFAWLDALLAAAGVALLARMAVSWRTRRGTIRWALGLLASVARASALLYLAFLAVWGLNYRRTPATTRFAVDPQRVGPERLRALVARSVGEVNRLAREPRHAARLEWPRVVDDLGPAFAAATRASGTAWSVVPGRPKASLAGRTFPWAAVDGMVNPLGLEVIVNPEVLPFERPFVLAHEWAHLAGHADESEASFVGLLACWRGSVEARYSGWLALLVHAVRGLPAAERRTALDALEPGPRADLRAIGERVGRAQPLVHTVSWQVYDRYLRANRVDAGVASYDEVTRLVLGSALTESAATPPAAFQK